MRNYTILLLIAFVIASNTFAQYAPQAPLSGHRGVKKDDVRLSEWAIGCTSYRGWLNIADKTLGQPTYGSDASVVGIADEIVLSLGDSGVAVVTFAYTLKNGDGPDFAVFENAFANPLDATVAYMELAFVEVSSDGINFTRFAADCEIQDTVQIDNFTYSNATQVNNLAGKYISGYGTPFDLEELKGTTGLDVNNISHVRIVDCVGSIDTALGSFDAKGHIINDPYTTAFYSGGFDLNAIGVLNSNKPVSVTDWQASIGLSTFPNPVLDILYIKANAPNVIKYTLRDITGKQMASSSFRLNETIAFGNYPSGIYLLQLQDDKHSTVVSITKQ